MSDSKYDQLMNYLSEADFSHFEILDKDKINMYIERFEQNENIQRDLNHPKIDAQKAQGIEYPADN